jgi:hypothetical protein
LQGRDSPLALALLIKATYCKLLLDKTAVSISLFMFALVFLTGCATKGSRAG